MFFKQLMKKIHDKFVIMNERIQEQVNGQGKKNTKEPYIRIYI